jgi:hypothetical protein
MANIENLESRVFALECQVNALRKKATFYDHWHDTMHSHWYHRLWWWMCGYRILSLGRWYKAKWNTPAEKYEV